MAACSASRAERVLRWTGIWPDARRKRPTMGTSKSEDLARNLAQRPENARYCARTIGSTLEMWLATTTIPPLCGTLSWPRQSRRLNGLSNACAHPTAQRYAGSTGSRLASANDRRDVRCARDGSLIRPPDPFRAADPPPPSRHRAGGGNNLVVPESGVHP